MVKVSLTKKHTINEGFSSNNEFKKIIAKKTIELEELGICMSHSISKYPRQCPINLCQNDLGEQGVPYKLSLIR